MIERGEIYVTGDILLTDKFIRAVVDPVPVKTGERSGWLLVKSPGGISIVYRHHPPLEQPGGELLYPTRGLEIDLRAMALTQCNPHPGQIIFQFRRGRPEQFVVIAVVADIDLHEFPRHDHAVHGKVIHKFVGKNASRHLPDFPDRSRPANFAGNDPQLLLSHGLALLYDEIIKAFV